MADVIEVSAPGKLILHGEHAVVYGKAAIAANLDLRCRLKVQMQTEPYINLQLIDIGVSRQWSIEEVEDGLVAAPVAGSPTDPEPASEEAKSVIKQFAEVPEDNEDTKDLAIIAFLYIYNSLFQDQSFPAISVHMKSDIPVGAGLGSSAAFSVSLSAALLQLAGVIKSEKRDESTLGWSPSDQHIINKWGFVAEKIIHGRPSGIDNAVSTYGGALRFEKGNIAQIEKMPTLSVMLVNTNVPRSTLSLVANLRKRYNKHKEIYDPILDAVEAVSEKSLALYRDICDCPKDEDYVSLGEMIDLNHQLLNIMGVGHPFLDHVISVASKHSLHAKLTGAGGGGCAFILVPPGTDESVVEKAASEMEFRGFTVWRKKSVGGPGVFQHLVV